MKGKKLLSNLINIKKMERPILNLDKLKKETHSGNEYLDKKYGVKGTPEREEFSKKALSYYYGELIKETRKE